MSDQEPVTSNHINMVEDWIIFHGACEIDLHLMMVQSHVVYLIPEIYCSKTFSGAEFEEATRKYSTIP